MTSPARSCSKGGAFGGVGLADVVVEDVDGIGVTVDECFEPAAGADGAELVVVADDDGLGAVDLGCGEQAEHGLVVDHPGFVDHEDGVGVQGLVAVSEPPQQGGGGA